MLAGLEQPTDGDVYIDDARVTEVPPGDRNLSMVFQSLALWDHKTVRENIGFGLKMEGVAEGERNAAIDEIAELLQISEKLEQSPAALSGGQQQRDAVEDPQGDRHHVRPRDQRPGGCDVDRR